MPPPPESTVRLGVVQSGPVSPAPAARGRLGALLRFNGFFATPGAGSESDIGTRLKFRVSRRCIAASTASHCDGGGMARDSNLKFCT
jgi:hypothetical protein